MTKSELYARINRVRFLDEAMSIIDERIARLENCTQGHAIRYDRDKVQTAPSDPISGIIDELSDLLDRRRALCTQMAEAVTDISALCDRVQDRDQRLVLYLRYMSGLGWPEIARRGEYKPREVYRLHDGGIDAILRSVRCQRKKPRKKS